MPCRDAQRRQLGIQLWILHGPALSAYLTLVFVVLLPRVQLRFKVEQLMSFLCFLPVSGLLQLR